MKEISKIILKSRRRTTHCLWGIIVFFLAVPALAQEEVRLISPDGHLTFRFELTDSLPTYSIFYKGNLLVKPSSLSLSFKGTGDFGEHLEMDDPVFKEGRSQYVLVVGKTKHVNHPYRQVKIPLKEKNGGERKVNLLVQIFNDGVAFRYVFPKQKKWQSYLLTNEKTTIRLNGDPILLALPLPNFTTSHEGKYATSPFSRFKSDTLLDMPLLIQFPENINMAVTEAQLLDFAGMYLVKRNGRLESRLSPLPGQQEVKVKTDLPHQSPWRVFMISDRIGALIESNILTSLNEPNKIKETSWIKPGKISFHWWNGDIMKDTIFGPGNNFRFNKYYIDFCAENGIDYHTVIGYGNTPWYKNDGIGYQPGPNTDVTQVYPGLDMQKICDYAESKGVGIRVWVHWKALYPQLEKAFTLFEKWGIKGMMVDFLDRDDQEMVNIQTEILEKAADHHLEIQFHGAYKPTGLSRTYPNQSTREGALNYENNKWGNPIKPDDDLNIVFTRLLAGATDYHLGGFRAVPPSEYKAQYTRPLMLGTRAHMLAMYVVLESYISMVADYPEAYKGETGFEFLRKVPTTWEETRVPSAKVGEWVTIARRKGKDWYMGTINNDSEREITILLDFLDPGIYTAEVYFDGPDVEQNPNHIIKKMMEVNSEDTLKIKLQPGGGEVVHFYPRNDP
ncbi:MAG: glycoside hydrolase family 97 protein [Christiangramia sp.]|uniref:glycoside hydrolase family 97 protein n=1 Tax=Christiangramia sp. TaxID=1931228 RepID=UPI003242C1B9